MKKTITLFLCVLALFAMTACGGKGAGDDMSLEEIITQIQKDVPDLPQTAEVPVTNDNYKYYYFIDPVEGADTLTCDAMINAIPHSAVLMRVPDGTDAEAVADSIRQNANQSKWLCVSADAAKVSVHNQTILLVMSTEDITEKMVSNFDNLWK